MTRSEPDFPVSITADALRVPEHTAESILKIAEGALGESRDYLGPLHLGLLAALADLGRLPSPERLRSSRDIAPIQHSLADLETVGLTRSVGHGLVALTEAASESIREALARHFAHSAADALGQLSRNKTESWRAPALPPPMWTWMRNLLTFLSYRGLRITGQGVLHRSDLRRFESICELPPRQFLDDCLTAGLGLDLFFAHDGQLIIGDGVDLIDLQPAALAREILFRWVSGRIRTALEPISVMAGLLGGWLDPLQSVSLPNDRGSERLFRHAEDTDGLVEAALGPMPFDPISGLMTGKPRREDLQSARVELLLAHRRIRAGLLTLLSSLPRRTRLPLDTVAQLVHAHIALDHIRRPTRPPGNTGGAALFSGATQILPAFASRIKENLVAWLEALVVPTGAHRAELRVVPADPRDAPAADPAHRARTQPPARRWGLPAAAALPRGQPTRDDPRGQRQDPRPAQR